LKAKEQGSPEFPVISGGRKESHLACNHEASISLYVWRGGPVISSKLSDHAPAALCGCRKGSFGKAHIQPMLAAQSAFPSGPLAGFDEKFD
jgi:hypothetical protein